jgi:hypothetical protein
MPIMHDGVQRASTSLRLAPSSTATREAGSVSQPQVSLDRGIYERTSTRPAAFHLYPFPTPMFPVPVDWLSRVEPTRDRLEGIRAEFESCMKARGARAREEIFQRLLWADPSDLLAVGFEQYAARGNGDRLVLTADLLASAGSKAYEALERFTRCYRPELIYFVDGMATSDKLTSEEKGELLVRIARAAHDDVDLRERLESALTWLSAALRGRIRERMRTQSITERAA